MSDTAADRYRNLLTRLVKVGAKLQLPPHGRGNAFFDGEEISCLLSNASRLALSTDAKCRDEAYVIVTLLLELTGNEFPGVVGAAELIFSRIGNFPALTFTHEQFQREGLNNQTQPITLLLEELSRRTENEVTIKKEDIVLTDFQKRLFDALGRWNSVSVSAPTSAGKSFLLSLDVIRELTNYSGSIVFVVPTRALIRQVIVEINEQLLRFAVDDVDVISVPEPPSDSSTGTIYVLTQERLNSLLSAHLPKLDISLLIVDEAQELGDGSRGIVLQSAIERVLVANPETRVLFAAPLRSNPGFLLGVFRREEQGEFFVERTSPVSQRILVVNPVSRKPKRAEIHLQFEGDLMAVEEIDLSFSYREPRRQLVANFAAFITPEDDCTIVYVNEPSQAEGVALELSTLVSASEPVKPEILELISYVEEEIHREHPLIQCLKRGVAFHYGNMPEIVRGALEDLIRMGFIRFVCCTSTLLQGVNLPAKNVVMYKPTRGRGTPLDAGGFWNLAGRAGRLMKEYSGNVWCLSPGEWESNPLEVAKLTEITAAFSEELFKHPNAVGEAAEAHDRPAENDATLVSDHTFAKVFSDYTLEEISLLNSRFCNDANQDEFVRISKACDELAATLEMPKEIFKSNGTVSPYRIEELGTHFDRSSDNPELLVPIHPLQKGAYARLLSIFEALETVFFKTGTHSFKYHTAIAHHWMTGTSLRDLIIEKIDRDGMKKSVSTLIRELLKDIETILRYRYVKYLGLYCDGLSSFLAKSDRIDLIERIAPIHHYLEYGSSDPAVFHLIGLGLSRSAALAVSNVLRIPNKADVTECKTIIRNENLESKKLSPIVLRELRKCGLVGT